MGVNCIHLKAEEICIHKYLFYILFYKLLNKNTYLFKSPIKQDDFNHHCIDSHPEEMKEQGRKS